MSQLAKNTIFLTFASIAQKAIAFLYFAVVARTIGDEATGSYFLALALTTTIGVLDDVGLTSVLIREVAKTPEKASDYLRSVMGVKIFTMPLTVLVAWFLPTVLGFSQEAADLTKIAVVIMLLDTLSVSFYGVMRGFHNLKFESLGIFVGQSITAIVGVAALFSGERDLRYLILALMLGSLWNAGFAAFQVARKIGWQSLVPSFVHSAGMLRTSFMFFMAAVFVKVYSYVDSFTINMTLGKAAVGVYSVAYKLTYAFQFLPMAFVGALYPTLSAQAHDPALVNKTLSGSFRYMALLGAPIVFGIAPLAPEIIGFFYGSDFSDAAGTLSVLIFVLLFIFLDFPIGALLNASGRPHIKTGIMGITMIINVVANLVLVPEFGVVGAAYAGLLSFIFMFFAGLVAVWKSSDLRVSQMVSLTGPYLLAGGVMSLVVLGTKTVVPWIATVPIGAVVFMSLTYLLGGVTRADIQGFVALVRKKVA